MNQPAETPSGERSLSGEFPRALPPTPAQQGGTITLPLALFLSLLTALLGGGGGATLYRASAGTVTQAEIASANDRVARAEGEVQKLAGKVEQLQLAGARVDGRLDAIVATLAEIKQSLHDLAGAPRRR